MRFNPFALAKPSRRFLARSATSSRLISARPRQQSLRIESLEQRALLAIDTASLATATGNYSPLDTSRDGYISAVDALLIINELNRTGGGPLAPVASASATGTNGLAAASTPTPNPLDVDGDGFLSATDAILVINKLNADAAADADDLIQIRLQVTDLGGNAITQIAPGGSFLLKAFVFDLRATGNEGVFAAFADVTYESSLASANGAIDHGIYATGSSGTNSPGLIDEIGGISGQISPPLGPAERLLFSVPMVAGATPGTIHFVADPADLVSPTNPTHNSLLFNDPAHTIGGVPTTMIAFGSVNLEVLPGPTLSIADPAAIVEGDVGSAQLSFAVTLADAEPGQTVTVNYTTQPLTAGAGTDYQTKSGTLTFAPGVTTQNILIDVLGDTLDEDNETFQVILSTPSGAGLAKATAIGTINDNDAPPVVSIADPVATTETDGNSVLNFAVSLSAPSGQTVTVQYTTIPGTALAGSDFTSASGTVTFAPGETTKNIPITILGDTVDEPTEAFQVQLSAPSLATLGNATATGTILDNDPLPTLSVSSPTVTEPSVGTTNLTFVLSLSKASGQPITVSYTTANGTATSGTDYQQIAPTQVTFAPGETTKQVSVAVNSDADVENNETLTLNVTSVGTPVLPAAQGTGTIRDQEQSDKQIRIRLVTTDLLGNPISQIIATQPFLVTGIVEDLRSGADLDGVFQAYLDILYSSSLVSVTGPITYGADFPNAQSGSTATPGVIDEIGAAGTQAFPANPAGEKKLFSVQVVGIAGGIATFATDQADLPPTHDILLYGGTGAVPAEDVLYTGTSIEILPPPTLSIGPISVTEGNVGNTPASFLVTLANSLNQTVTVNYTTQPVTATDGVDYEPKSGTLTFAPGESSKTIVVNVLGDTLDELTETFNVILSNAIGASITAGTATGTIVDDDLPPTVSIATPASTTETDSASVLNFVVSLSTASGQTVTVQYNTLAGTAQAGSDFTSASGTLTFAPGETTKSIPITIVGDSLDEPIEAFQVQISAPTLATLGTATATGTIVDNDPLPVLSVSNPTATEPSIGTTALTFTISLSKVSGQPITVSYQTANGTATAGSDYQAIPPTQVTFAPGETTKTVTVLVNTDEQVEENETLTLNVTSVGTPVLPAAQGTGTIRDQSLVGKQARIRLVTTDLAGNPISQITATDPFLITAFVDDLRGGEDQHGVFQAYLDILYNSGLISATGPITYGAAFPNAQAGSTGTAGVLDEVGAAGSQTFPPNPGDPMKLFSVQVVGIAGGTATFTPDQADVSPTHDILMYGGTGPVPVNDVVFIGASIVIDPPPAISIGPATIVEGDAGTKEMSFTVSLSKVGTKSITVQYGTSPQSATAGADYQTATGSLTFAVGETSKTIKVNILGDTLDEDNETFAVNLSSPSGATIATASATGTITDDDASPTISVGNAEATEGISDAVFTVTLSTASGRAVTVNYSTFGGTATAGADFASVAGQLTFAPGETTKTVTVPVNYDLDVEPTENFTLVLSNASNATVVGGTGQGTISDILLSSLSGWVYIDANKSLAHDAGDFAVAQIPVTLTGFNLFGEFVSVPTQSDANGYYQFSNLLPGNYTLTETHPFALADGTDNLGTLGGILLNDQFLDIVVTVGSFGTEYNFGEAGVNPAFLTDGNFYASSLNGRK